MEKKSKSQIIIEKNNGLNYNGDYNKLKSLKLPLIGIEKAIEITANKF